MAVFVCPVCGHVLTSKSMPKDYICPICGTKGSQFRRREKVPNAPESTKSEFQE